MILIIGYGSIGQRHYNLIKSKEWGVGVVTKREFPYENFFYNIEEAIRTLTPNVIIIANETNKHLQTLRIIDNENFKGAVLVEKPLFSEVSYKYNFSSFQVYVGYNLRFHPLMMELYKLIQKEKVLTVNVYAGQYLPEWRPGTDYTQSYSASRQKGGGVLRDLSHELDYILWLFGDWNSVVSNTGQIGDLDIETEDSVSILLKMDKVPQVQVMLNYLDRSTERFLIVNTFHDTYKLDLIRGKLLKNGEIIQEVHITRNKTYEDQLLDLVNKRQYLCTFDEAVQSVNLIDKIEKSNREGKWIKNE
ncbi:Gfo/Idh/MocA family protein [Salibacterium qingdaonense]|uniref:Predicted dehydrogenase n=1 Tax=Salibacterium qingdaonense TaxID=266892 RepID=A0A1I4KZM3_9BACI|nr:Gfo/Idh/MocA family oxidoreductase [Salibacterium qingdaonense]SFL84111.1 Predicted dehydrogenase [Salibacterium qingdaonense]